MTADASPELGGDMFAARKFSLSLVVVVVLVVAMAVSSTARADDVVSVVQPGVRALGVSRQSNGPGTGGLDFWVGSDGSLQSSDGVSLGGLLTSDPDTSLYEVTPTVQTQMVFARGVDGHLWFRAFTVPGGPSGGWESLGGDLTSGPGASATKDNLHVDVFVRGSDGGVWHRHRNINAPSIGPQWSPWEPVGGQITSDPDSATNAYDLGVDVVARGVDGAVWFRRATGRTQWQDWLCLGGQVTSGPSIASDGQRTVVAGRGLDGSIWLRELAGQAWGPWYPIGGLAMSDPDVRVDASGPPSVVVRGVDGALWVAQATTTTWTWSPLPYGS
jgi:hypothetical protein